MLLSVLTFLSVQRSIFRFRMKGSFELTSDFKEKVLSEQSRDMPGRCNPPSPTRLLRSRTNLNLLAPSYLRLSFHSYSHSNPDFSQSLFLLAVSPGLPPTWTHVLTQPLREAKHVATFSREATREEAGRSVDCSIRASLEDFRFAPSCY